MEEEKYFEFNFWGTDIGAEAMSEFKRLTKNQNIKKGMKQTIKPIGRPLKISNKKLEKAYQLWEIGKITQKQIAETFKVSERTINRQFKKMEGEEN